MATNRKQEKASGKTKPGALYSLVETPGKQTVVALAAYTFITMVLTFPLIFKMNSSVYGPYDHATTDLFAAVYQNFWWLAKAVFDLHTTPFMCPFLAAPYGTRMNFVNFTGFPQIPISGLFGAVFAMNVNTMLNLILAGLGMFFLVRHITKSASAGFVSGLIFAFCPNMLVRSYTTFDSTQVQWIPFFTLYILKFIETHTWKHALMTGVFLACHILFSFPYYLVYLPVHTIVMLVALAVWHIKKGGMGFGGFLRALLTPAAFRAWLRIGTSLALVVVVFGVYYKVIVGGSDRIATAGRTTEQLEELAQVPTDYLVPHFRMALLKSDFKAVYWDNYRPGKDPDSFVAYIGFLALALAAYGLWKGRGVEKWVFFAGALVAFWSTLGPSLFGLPTPSGLIHILYASFARRILIYKVFVQFGIAGLAGLGFAAFLKYLPKRETAALVFCSLSAAIIAEYSLTPPALSVNLTETPVVYQHVRDLPAETRLIEVPVLRSNGYWYQGYLYYQQYHQKPLFNAHFGLSGVPEQVRPFYEQMTVPIEACEYANLSSLRYLGITHLTYHWYIGTNTVTFKSHAAPVLYNKDVPGLRILFQTTRDPFKVPYEGPYDYSFADLYEITADPCPIAITFDNPSPYEQSKGMSEDDYMIRMGDLFTIGWESSLMDTTRTFYYPLPNGDKVDRLARQGATVTVTNLSDSPVDFNISFSVSSDDSGRVIEARWNGGEPVGKYEIGPEEKRYTLESMRLEGSAVGTISFFTDREAYRYYLGTATLMVNAVLRDVRAKVKN